MIGKHNKVMTDPVHHQLRLVSLRRYGFVGLTMRLEGWGHKKVVPLVCRIVSILALTSILTTACYVTIVHYDETKDENPIWSPDGHRIAFVSHYISSSRQYNGGAGPYEGTDAFNWMEICLMDADGTNRHRLTDNDVSDRDPDWSPDGDKIVFASRRALALSQAGSDKQGRLNLDIFVMDINGSEQLNITSHPSDDKHPHWSPNGQLIAFISNRDGSDNGDVFTMKPDGNNVARRTNMGWVSDLNWAPDSKRLAFYSRSDGDWEIYVLNLEDNSLVRLTDNEAEDMQPVWSPDAQSIVFASDRDGGNQIYVMNLETLKVMQISSGADANWGATWSPDNRLISYVTRQGANAELHIWDLVKSKSIVVAKGLSVNGQVPRWAPDGQSLVYTREEDVNRDGFSEEKIWIVQRDGTGERRLSPDRIDK